LTAIIGNGYVARLGAIGRKEDRTSKIKKKKGRGSIRLGRIEPRPILSFLNTARRLLGESRPVKQTA
jgi:hypothetical protein